MYHSLSETRHPLQPEEQEVGIDPLWSYSKSGGEFCMQIHSAVIGTHSRRLPVSSACLICKSVAEAEQATLKTFPCVSIEHSYANEYHEKSTFSYRWKYLPNV